ncbi:hypothetical protein [Pedobacter nototheniae]|uniref:hypothetical protein n=1 Tax=Pedobacter nototheniae TaxID=2488994 RepID=UPI00103B78E5|nr:hypothetical protein [Pedobacter nototheniae]
MYIKILFVLSSILFQTQNITRSWDGSDTPGHSYATFEEFNGKQDFKIKLNKKESFTFKYSAIIKKGTLHLAIKSGSKTIYEKDIKDTVSDEVKVDYAEGKKYSFTFTALHAKGSFDVRY